VLILHARGDFGIAAHGIHHIVPGVGVRGSVAAGNPR